MCNLPEKEKQLRPKLTDEFLETLVLCVRTIGWDADVHETISFAQQCFWIAGKEIPHSREMMPLDDESWDR